MRAFQIVIDRQKAQSLPKHAGGSRGMRGMVDMLVDGTNITARLGPEHVAPLVRDLAYAASDLATGRRSRATVHFYMQKAAWAMGLERVDDRVLVTVFRGGDDPMVAVDERPVDGRQLLRGVREAVEQVQAGERSASPLASDLKVVGRVIEQVAWLPESNPAVERAVLVEGVKNASFSLGCKFPMRVRAPVGRQQPEVERNDLHSLLFVGELHVRSGRAARTFAPILLFPALEVLVSETAVAMEHWRVGRAYVRKRVTAGTALSLRLSREGVVDFGVSTKGASPFTSGSQFGAVPMEEFVDSVLSAVQGVVRALHRYDRSQMHNLRVISLRERVQELSETLKDIVSTKVQYNDSPESYRAFANARVPKPTEGRWTNRPVQFSLRWEHTVTSIDIDGTVLFDEHVVFTGGRDLTCLDKASGEVLWRRRAGDGVTIGVPGGVLRVGADGGIQVHDLETGEVTRRARLTARNNGLVPSGSLVNAPGLPRLVVLSEGSRHISAFDLLTGEIRWRHALGRGRSFKVRRAGKLLIVSSSESALTAVDVSSGETVWRVHDRQPFARPAAYSDDQLFVITGSPSARVRGGDTLLSLDPWTGLTRWKKSLRYSHRTMGAPMLSDEHVMVETSSVRGCGFVGFSRETGEHLWTVEPGFAPRSAGVALVDDLLVVNGNDGFTSAIDPATGEVRWRLQLDGPDLRGDAPRRMRPVFGAGGLYVPQQTVYVLRPSDGVVLGEVETDMVPDNIRVDRNGHVVITEETGLTGAFAASPRLRIV